MYVLTALMILIAAETCSASTNERPIIGILSQELSPILSHYYGQRSSYIAASYVKFVEGAGGRVVPIRVNQTEDYYREITSHINGLLFPGGAASFGVSDGYSAAAQTLYNIALEMNRQGDYFPILGICLGFELLLYLAAGEREIRCRCAANNLALPLQFKDDFEQSKMFRDIPENVMESFTSENVTSHFHIYCVTEQNFTEFGLSDQWQSLALSTDLNGLEFISSIESRTYPFYGLQFHPEKNGYEFKSTRNIPHGASAVLVMQYMADFFVNEARKNSHSFPSEQSEEASLIYQYNPTYTENHLIYEQCYFFDN